MNETIIQDIERKPMQSATIGKLAHALSKAQGQMSGAAKSANNPFFKSKYADLNECIEAAKKPLADNELAVIQTTELGGKGVIIVTTLAHSSGEWIKGKIDMAPKKDDDQSRGSSITYGRRYAFAAIVGLAQKDDDGNAATEEPKSRNQQPEQKSAACQQEQPVDQAVINGWMNYIQGFKAGVHNLAQFRAVWKTDAAPKLANVNQATRNLILNAKRDKEAELST